jgi:hypothetical protein
VWDRLNLLGLNLSLKELQFPDSNNTSFASRCTPYHKSLMEKLNNEISFVNGSKYFLQCPSRLHLIFIKVYFLLKSCERSTGNTSL